MADKIVFDYPEMESASKNIENIANEYESAARTFRSSISNAITGWEGASKDKFAGLLDNSVYKYMEVSVPQLVQGLATMLKNNADGMKQADDEIAKNIPDSL